MPSFVGVFKAMTFPPVRGHCYADPGALRLFFVALEPARTADANRRAAKVILEYGESA
jgi:hypothetical protein